MMLKAPICLECKHFDIESYTCGAFVDSIPEEILLGENDHKKPLPGQDNDIVFEAKEDSKSETV